MQIFFRTDASTDMGYGHVMRCLTLADELRKNSHLVSFICQELTGHLAEMIRKKGFDCFLLTAGDWQQDVNQSLALLEDAKPDWIVVDHYLLDSLWHQAIRSATNRVMVIDDLANRVMDCDLLLDTGMGKRPEDYSGLVPEQCQVITGVEYALIRNEFSERTGYAIDKRADLKHLKKVLINFGGMDQSGLIPLLLAHLLDKFDDLNFSVIVSSSTPNLSVIRQLVDSSQQCRLLLDIDTMPDEIVDADLAIGAAGVTAYERCVLGLPSIVIPVADNQEHFVAELEKHSAVRLVRRTENLPMVVEEILRELMDDISEAASMSRTCFDLVDGMGASRVVQHMESLI